MKPPASSQAPSLKDMVLKEGATVILMSALTILLAILLSEVQTRLGWRIVLTALGTVIVMYSVVLLILSRNVMTAVITIGEDLRRGVEGFLDTKRPGWLMTTIRLAEMEASKQVPEVWLVTSDMAEDVVGGPFQKVVSARLKSGVRYRYFIPDRPEMRARAAQLNLINENSDRLSFNYINDEFFFLVPNLDLVIYDPFNQSGEREGYLGIPAWGAAKHYHAKIDSGLVDVMIGKLLPLVEGSKPKVA
jgi:hypothetical protein